MTKLLLIGLIVVLATASPAGVVAQGRRPAESPKPSAAAEIKLDETTTLKAAALEARMAALVANYALLQRQAQDIQQEMKTLLEDRKNLIEGAAKKVGVEVRDAYEWAFDNKAQRYIHVMRGPAGAETGRGPAGRADGPRDNQ